MGVGEELADCLGVVGSIVLELAFVHNDDVVSLGEQLDLARACLSGTPSHGLKRMLQKLQRVISRREAGGTWEHCE